MACRLDSAKLLSEPMLEYCQLDLKEHISVIFFIQNSKVFIQANALENVICEMVVILFRPQCVNEVLWHSQSNYYWNCNVSYQDYT